MNKDTQDQKKEQILSSALTVMTSKGYFGSTMDDIVKESKMSKGAIYHYFKSKKEVYLAVIDYWERKYTTILSQEINEQKSSLNALKKLFKTFAKQLEKDPFDYFANKNNIIILKFPKYILNNNEIVQLTFHNEEFAKNKSIGMTEKIAFRSFDNAEIHGMLVKPRDFDPEKKYPLL